MPNDCIPPYFNASYLLPAIVIYDVHAKFRSETHLLLLEQSCVLPLANLVRKVHQLLQLV